MTLTLRPATPADLPHLQRVMRASMASLGPGFYSPEQVASAVEYIAVADPQIVEDGTYFAVEDGDQIVACGGWSKRKKLFTGPAGQAAVDGWLDPKTEPARIRAMFVLPEYARRGIGRMIIDRAEAEAREAGFDTCELMATLPGVPLYEACGYERLEDVVIELPDGMQLACIRMARRVK